MSPSVAKKVGFRGLGIEDAQAVYERDPLWRWQPGSHKVDESGQLQSRPDRWRLVGRGLGGAVLSVIIELPDDNGDSQVVTIFEASPRYRSEYAEWRRRQ